MATDGGQSQNREQGTCFYATVKIEKTNKTTATTAGCTTDLSFCAFTFSSSYLRKKKKIEHLIAASYQLKYSFPHTMYEPKNIYGSKYR